MDPIAYAIGAVVGLLLALLPLILLARVSHWTHATQAKLDETNRLLAESNRLAGQIARHSMDAADAAIRAERR